MKWDLDAPGTPKQRMQKTFLSSTHDRKFPSRSPLTPLVSVPAPANAFSISSTRRMTLAPRLPAMIFEQYSEMFLLPPMSASVSSPSKNDSPGVAEIIPRFRSQRPLMFMAP